MKSTIQKIFLENVQSDSDTGITFIDERNSISHLSYKRLYLEACYKLNALQERGLSPGDELIFQFESNRNFVITFWACVLGKIIPVPVAFVAGRGTIEKICGIWKRLNNPFIITDNPTLKGNFSEFQNDADPVFGEMLERFLVFDELKNSKKATPLPADESDIVFIQFSSGSTGTPKGITNTQEAILYNYQDYLANIRINEEDRFLGWVPLIHDMGLIFFHLVPLLSNVAQYQMLPTLFVAYPELWMERMSEYKITISGSPNFGYRMILDNFDRINVENLSLDSVRLLINSAEPVSIDDCRRFSKVFAPYGLSKNSVKAAYGLADAVLGVSMNYKEDEKSKEYFVNRNTLHIGNEVTIAEKKSGEVISFANLGTHGFTQITIVNEDNQVVPDRTLGYIKLKSKAVTKSYYNDPEISQEIISSDGWLNTGDIGFLDNNDLVMTGRAKEMIIINGQNYFPNDLDLVLSEMSEINFQQAVSCNIFNESTHRDEIFVFVLSKNETEDFQLLAHDIRTHISVRLGLQVSKVIPVGQIPKTTSGKIQRYLLKKRYLNGEYDQSLEGLDSIDKDVNTDLYTPPTTQTESRLVNIWQEYFDIDKIGIEANFYFLGGNSIGMGKLAALIEEEFEISIDLRKLFTCVEFEDQVKLIENAIENPFKTTEKVPVKLNYPLYTTQKRLYALYESDVESIAYNTPVVIEIEGSLDIQLCEDVFKRIIQRHEILRTSFGIIDGKPTQRIHDDFDFEIESVEGGDSLEVIKKYIKPFNLGTPPLLRVLACKEGNVYTKIILDVHHIVADGVSFEILIREFNQLYAKETLAPLRFQYRDFLEWNEEKLKGLDVTSQKAFWMNQYAEPVEPINLPTDVKKEAQEKFDGATLVFDLNDNDQKKLRELCKKEKVTMSTVTLAIFYVLLSKLTNNKDVVISTSSHGRWKKEFKDLIGLFIDTLPIRSSVPGDLKFSEFLQNVNLNVSNCIKNGEFSFEKLYNELKLEKNASSNFLYDIAFEYYNFNRSSVNSSDLQVLSSDQVNVVSKFPLVLRIIEQEQGCKFCLDYSVNSFSRETMERFGNYYQEIVKTITDDNSIVLKDIQILSDTEIDQQLNEFNDTDEAYEKDKTIIEVFASQVKNNPDKIALVFEDENLTYKELDDRSNGLARYLNKKAVNQSSLIGLCLDKSINMIVGILAILKSGRGYVPIDPTYPLSRIKHMVEDSGLELIITQGTILESYDTIEKVLVDIDKDLIDKESTRKISSTTNFNDVAYVMYTPGSTENPKGVVIHHQNVVSLVKQSGALSIKSKDNVLQWSNIAFNGAVSDIFCSLLNGATLYVIDKRSTSDLKSLSTFIKENEISVAFFTTAIFNVFVDTEIEGLVSLRKLLFGGERASIEHVQKAYDLLGPDKMINCYGSVENTVYTTYYPINERPKQNIPIGKPVSNTKTYVLDSSNNLCGIGITGELHIGGDRLSIGYIGDQEKTASKFIANPFESGSRIFKTGDLVKWLPDGNLEFVGREDYQVTLKGFRIELSHIELQLDTFNAVNGSVVLVKEIEGEEHIVAYYTSKDPIENSKLRAYLSAHFPDYMLPSLFVYLKEFPLTSNGKVNRKVLPEPTVIEEGYMAPNNEIEHRLVGVWADVLNINPEIISINRSFFNFGGYSLNVLFLISRIHKEFAIKMSPSDIIANPTIVDLQNFISTSSNVDHISIPISEIRTHYPLSSSQKRMYYSYEYDKDSIGYNVPMIYILNGQLDKEKLKLVLNILIQRHENLRTIFEFFDGELMQRILPEIEFDIRTLENGKDLEEVLKYFVQPFNLNEAPLFRAGLKCISDTEHILIIDTHHIISDGITNSILLKELISLYNDENLPDLRIQYKDYVIWEHGEEHQKEIEEHKKYWLERFSKETSTLELPYDYPRPKEFNVLGKNHAIELAKNYADKLNNITQSEGVTMYTLVLALYNLLLYKLSDQKDIVIGTSVAGRSHIDLESIAGVFINTLALRNNLEGKFTFREFLQQVKHNSSKDLEHQLYPYDDLMNALNVERVSGRSTLFDVFLAYHSITDDCISNDSELKAKLYENLFPSAQFDLILTVLNFEDKLKLNFTYRDELFKEDTVVRFMSYLKRIIDQILVNETILIDEINILSQKEVDQQLYEFNDTTLPFEKESSLVSILEENVSKHPDRIAISYEGEALTYKELDDQSNKVANYLISEGVIPNVVGLLIDRSMDMIVGMWGALKVGAGYLPLDPTLPEERVRYMLDQSSATFLLTHERHLEAYSAYLPVQSIDASKIHSQSTERITFKTEPTDLAYCIFTSGSTGKPKGVMINHRNVVNLVKGLEKKVYNAYGTKVLRVALLASYAFDASGQQIFGALLQGHSLYIANDASRKDGAKLLSFFNENRIDVSDGTPTHLRLFLNSLDHQSRLESLSSWLLAGEILSKDLVSTFYSSLGEKTQLYNFYGPTETCVDSTCFKIDPKKIRSLRNIPIGKPLPNERAYVTNSNGALVPVGVIGELCIAGDGLAQRYVGDQSLTTEKFTSDWIPQEHRVYRTGDMVKWLPDGNLEFHGRKDNQVKIRGYRIELDEIEKQLNMHPAIKHAVILVKESESEKYLVAYYQASDKIEISELRAYSGKFLPDYMIPSYYVYVEEFGLTVNGKVDYKALPDYKIILDNQDVIAPFNDVERKLVAIYAQVLNLDSNKIGSNSNFMELGGHSLKMVYLANGIKKELGVKVSIKQIIENPSISKLGNLVSQSVTTVHSHIPVSEPMEYYPLSSSQKRMYFAHEFDKESLSYNVPITITLKGVLDKQKLEESFVKLINHHDSLRTEFVFVEGELLQRIMPEVDFSIDYLDPDDDVDGVIKSFTKPFDLRSAPLLRVGVVEVSSQEHVMIMDCHHIISDEVTNAIILKDFSSIYNGENLPELRVQYKDFVMWQNEEEQQEEIKKHKEYWLDKFSNNLPVLELPYDFARSTRNSDQGGNVLIKIDQAKVQQLKLIALSEGLTLYNLFLSMYNILLYKLSNQKDIVVGSPVAGRPHHDLESMTGVFINTLPIRNQLQGDMTFNEFVQQVQKGSVRDFDHQLYPYQDFVDELHLERDLRRNPLFDVSFNFMKQDVNIMNLSGLVIEPYTIKYNQSKFDLNMIVVEREEDNYILMEYARQLFKENTVERFMSYFNNIIKAVCKDRTIKIADINILEEKENQLLNSFSPMNNLNQEENTIVSTFERQVIATPLATAIKYGALTYTYDDLNQKVNQLARNLQQEFDITRGDIIGVLLPKSDAAIVSILAILKLGAAYLPIDTSYPVERINYIIKNSGLKALITEDKSCSEKITLDRKINYETVIFDKEKKNLDIAISSDDLAYVIYTSGSTGKPKGVMIEHGSNVNMSTDIVKQLNVNDRDTILWFASIGFDASVYEIMMALYSGATLVIPEDGVINDTNRFCSLLSETRTTIVTLPPTYLETLPLEKLTSLRIITTAGESPNTKKAIEVIKSGIRYFNAYGPTECAVCVSTYEVFRDDEGLTNIPIGKPIANTEMVILDTDLKQVPVGVKGTIYVTGKAVARGYLNNPVLTEKSFTTLPNDTAKKYYNTGDLGEWTSNGLIIFHGRKDNQIKLRGYRIELGEIEGALSSIDYVRNCHVTLREGSGGERELVGFVIMDVALSKVPIEQDLGKLLPEYMIPKYWMQLDEFPLTINGKIDTEELLQPEVKGDDSYIAPSNDLEKQLTQIWSETLNIDEDKIGVLDDFFMLGGNSLIAIQLLTAINKNYGILLELQEVFRLKTIRGLSELIELDLWVNDDNKKETEYRETII
ncbi:surfactin non-ribosomal peptide synthetase SrfAB [Aquimarina addita]|uniref:Surfactin non-ribosomal peptide synthetase SrfAB n=1 Tax=Aquimarina addita TaxID=870485 RepID=A0ABP7XG99_9FLAO